MSLDHSAVWEKIQELVESDRPTGESMSEVIQICAAGVPHADWGQLSTLEYDADVVSLRPWIPGVFKKSPAPFVIRGLLVCLCNPSDSSRRVWADMYVGAVADYDPEDEEELNWVFNSSQSHYPEEGFAHSQSLRRIHEIGYASKTGLGNDAEWPLCLAFAAFAVRSLLRKQTRECVKTRAPRVGVAVGFDSGDMLKIGELTETGFVASGGMT